MLQANPNLTPADIKRILAETANRGVWIWFCASPDVEDNDKVRSTHLESQAREEASVVAVSTADSYLCRIGFNRRVRS